MPALAPVLRLSLPPVAAGLGADEDEDEDVELGVGREVDLVLEEDVAGTDDTEVGSDGTAVNESGASAMNVSPVGSLQPSRPLSPQQSQTPDELSHVIHVCASPARQELSLVSAQIRLTSNHPHWDSLHELRQTSS